MTLSGGSSTEEVVRKPDNRYAKLRGSNLWVTNSVWAGRFVLETFGPDYLNPPVYVPIANEERIMQDLIQEGIPVVLTGPPGIGKTTLIKSAIHNLGLPLQTFMASAATQVHELIGRTGTAGEKAELNVWVDGKLTMAARAAEGGYTNVFYIDEVIKMPKEIVSSLYSIIDYRQALQLPTGEELQMKGKLKMIFSYNPSREIRLDDALRTRLTAIRLGYPPPRVEIKVLCERTIGGLGRFATGEEVAAGMVRFANVIRLAHGYIIEGEDDLPKMNEEETRVLRILSGPPSPRMLVVAARMVSSGGYTPRDAVEMFLIPSLTQDVHDFDLRTLVVLLERLNVELVSAESMQGQSQQDEFDRMVQQHQDREPSSKKNSYLHDREPGSKPFSLDEHPEPSGRKFTLDDDSPVHEEDDNSSQLRTKEIAAQILREWKQEVKAKKEAEKKAQGL